MAIELDLNNIPTDPEELAKAFSQIEAGETVSDTSATDTKAQAADEVKNDATQAAEPKQDDLQAGDTEPAGVATKDGKHVIPYSVLKSERERASRAEQLAKDMQDRLAALEEQVKQSANGTNQGANTGESARTDAVPNVEDLSPEDLEALKEDFPTVYKGLKAMEAKATALERQLATVNESVAKQEATERRTVADQVQDAIDSVPKLAHIQSTNPEAFEMAKQFDAMLRAQPAWQGKSLADRFAKATEMVESALGAIEVPGQSQPTAAELKDAALKKAAAAAKGSKSVPTSLSDFPVGSPAASDELEAITSMTQHQLAEKLARMTPEQQDAYFASL